MNDKELLNLAENARKNAYAPYSGITVGAALLSEDGEVYLGANVENASFGATVCAERAALFSAVSCGKRRFSAIAIVGGRKNEAPRDSFTPCGICRQCLSEFSDGTLRVITERNGKPEAKPISELLPYGFSKDLL